MKLKNLDMKKKLLYTILPVIIISLLILIIITSILSSSAIKKVSYREADEMAGKYAAIIDAELEMAMDAARTVAQNFDNYELTPPDERRQDFINTIRAILEDNPDFVGICTAWEPNALDGLDNQYANKANHDATGRFIPYATRDESGKVKIDPLVDYDKEESEWYSLPKKLKEEVITEPYFYEINGKQVYMVTVSVPILSDGNDFLGIVTVDISLETIQNQTKDVKPFETGYAFLLSNKSILVAHPNKDNIGKSIADLEQHKGIEERVQSVKEGKHYSVVKKSLATGKYSYCSQIPINVGKSKQAWSFGIIFPSDKINAASVKITIILIIIGFVTILLITFVIFIIAREITTPIVSMVNNIKDLAEGDGDLTAQVKVDSKDELGQMAGYFNKFTGQLRQMIQEVIRNNQELLKSSRVLIESASNMQSGMEDMTIQMHTASVASEEISANVTGIASSSEQASHNIQVVATAAEEMSANVNTVASTTEQASANVKELVNSMRKIVDNISAVSKNMQLVVTNVDNSAAGIEEMSVSLKEVSDNTQKANSISRQANDQAQSTKQLMDALRSNANEIGKIVKVISDIADQTNMLALNATIEAASAGEAGKGFAVVANEVKELAKQTGEATGKISVQIESVQNATLDAANSIDKIAHIIDELNHISNILAQSVKEQANTTNEIAGSMNNAAVATKSTGDLTQKINQEIQIVNRNAEEAGLGVNSIATSSSEAAAAANEVARNSVEAENGAQKLPEIQTRLPMQLMKSAIHCRRYPFQLTAI